MFVGFGFKLEYFKRNFIFLFGIGIVLLYGFKDNVLYGICICRYIFKE